ncbi:hypothetical protein LMG28727_06137 [Paraburkholderia kirstenboschensis]|uniref:hypothetical protein n=1 Tax=Paraburkholderia kirstenboschensis TaxID=1245436 RepID=UPI000ADA2C01|nr:hypothetical protein [Paraburkholderia kirstenboschensis]CAD6556556.1 hypothetical protein LMG28727_06137 [Paraburkholderia kirstenboschensis]
MYKTLDFPAALAAARFHPAGKSLDEVVSHVELTLRETENEPEWLSRANLVEDANTDLYGLLGSTPWPEVGPTRRVSLSVERGNSEGWIIRVDLVELVGDGDTQFWKCRG